MKRRRTCKLRKRSREGASVKAPYPENPRPLGRIKFQIRSILDKLIRGLKHPNKIVSTALLVWKRNFFSSQFTNYESVESGKGSGYSKYPFREDFYSSNLPEISLIVLHYKDVEMTKKCVESIWQKTTGWKYELIIVDNGSATNFSQNANLNQKYANIIRLDVNRYFGEGNNIGFESSKGRFVFFLNNDVLVQSNWLEPLVSKLVDDPSVGAVGPKMVYPDGILQEAGAEIATDGTAIQYGKGHNPNAPKYNIERDVMYISAATIGIRRDIFSTVFGFDLVYEPAYYEDCDLCLKISHLGYKIRYVPASTVIHYENFTTGKVGVRLNLRSHFIRNRKLFTKRLKEFNEKRYSPIFEVPAESNEMSSHVKSFQFVLYNNSPLELNSKTCEFLNFASYLSTIAPVLVKTKVIYSHLRLRTLGSYFGIDVKNIKLGFN